MHNFKLMEMERETFKTRYVISISESKEEIYDFKLTRATRIWYFIYFYEEK